MKVRITQHISEDNPYRCYSAINVISKYRQGISGNLGRWKGIVIRQNILSMTNG